MTLGRKTKYQHKKISRSVWMCVCFRLCLLFPLHLIISKLGGSPGNKFLHSFFFTTALILCVVPAYFRAKKAKKNIFIMSNKNWIKVLWQTLYWIGCVLWVSVRVSECVYVMQFEHSIFSAWKLLYSSCSVSFIWYVIFSKHFPSTIIETSVWYLEFFFLLFHV